ncbi:hypothetical protein NDU88_005133 [Pleurodeles waltl]|uniref:Uncharacterized protein n=1 Tax=Pleurodeles waltl TaxID=8319 RepID=A0AAV7LM07_PLEWA|nr:hypothetical protein NDU88_005133 [Pleurodeles waltl]
MVSDKSSLTTAQQKIIRYAKQGVQSDNGGAATGAPTVEDSAQSATILQVIHDLKVTMEGKMGELKVDLALIWQDLRNTTHRVIEVECRLSETEDTVKTQEEQLVKLQRLVKQLEARA